MRCPHEVVCQLGSKRQGQNSLFWNSKVSTSVASLNPQTSSFSVAPLASPFRPSEKHSGYCKSEDGGAFPRQAQSEYLSSMAQTPAWEQCLGRPEFDQNWAPHYNKSIMKRGTLLCSMLSLQQSVCVC